MPGVVTITRSGKLDTQLTLHYSIAGSASAPADYQSLPGSLTIPSGETVASILVIPQPDDLAEGDEMLVITLQEDPSYQLPPEPTTTIQIKDRPLDAWRFAQFGAQANNSALTALLADPDDDGWNNLLEYALNLRPALPDTSPLVYDFATVGQERFLRLTVPKNLHAIGISYSVQATADLMDPDSWSNSGLVVEEDSASMLRVRDNVAVGPGITRFMRVRVINTTP